MPDSLPASGLCRIVPFCDGAGSSQRLRMETAGDGLYSARTLVPRLEVLDAAGRTKPLGGYILCGKLAERVWRLTMS